MWIIAFLYSVINQPEAKCIQKKIDHSPLYTSFLTIIDFSVTDASIQEQISTRLVQIIDTDYEIKRDELMCRRFSLQQSILKLEKELIAKISSDCDLLANDSLIQSIVTIQTEFSLHYQLIFHLIPYFIAFFISNFILLLWKHLSLFRAGTWWGSVLYILM